MVSIDALSPRTGTGLSGTNLFEPGSYELALEVINGVEDGRIVRHKTEEGLCERCGIESRLLGLWPLRPLGTGGRWHLLRR